MYKMYYSHLFDKDGKWISTKVMENKKTGICFHFMSDDLSRLYAIKRSNDFRIYTNKRYFKKYENEIKYIRKLIMEGKNYGKLEK